jgi:hypothetical protein
MLCSEPAAKSARRRADREQTFEPIAVRPIVAARAIGCSERKIWLLIAQGRLVTSLINGTRHVHTASLRKLLADTQV